MVDEWLNTLTPRYKQNYLLQAGDCIYQKDSTTGTFRRNLEILVRIFTSAVHFRLVRHQKYTDI